MLTVQNENKCWKKVKKNNKIVYNITFYYSLKILDIIQNIFFSNKLPYVCQ